MSQVVLSASFDNLQSRHMRLLQEAHKLGEVHVLLWSDQTVRAIEEKDLKFPQVERQYFVEAIRYVDHVSLADVSSRDNLPLQQIEKGTTWVLEEYHANSEKEAFCVNADRKVQRFCGAYRRSKSAALITLTR
ncbi:MAG: hypothetical protein ABGX16_06990 [Pirellulales bacterium]